MFLETPLYSDVPHTRSFICITFLSHLQSMKKYSIYRPKWYCGRVCKLPFRCLLYRSVMTEITEFFRGWSPKSTIRAITAEGQSLITGRTTLCFCRWELWTNQITFAMLRWAQLAVEIVDIELPQVNLFFRLSLATCTDKKVVLQIFTFDEVTISLPRVLVEQVLHFGVFQDFRESVSVLRLFAE